MTSMTSFSSYIQNGSRCHFPSVETTEGQNMDEILHI